MRTGNVLILISPLLLFVGGQDEKSLKEEGTLATCPLAPYDLTFSSSSTDRLKVYLMVGRASEYHVYNISKAAAILNDDAFRKDFRTVMFIHGYNDMFGGLGNKITEGYQIRGRHNILHVDMSPFSTIDYFRGSRAARYIGIRLGKLLSQLHKSGLNMDTFDLVGFSLGAHVAGYAGKSYYNTTRRLLPKIVGLDPAGPCFKGADVTSRLHKSDAQFVQVLHFNAGQLGIKIPIGHVDFYVNGGSRQPASGYLLPCLSSCSHLRAMDVWKMAVIYPDKFVGIQCTKVEEAEQGRCYQRGRKTAVMGLLANPKINGIFYVRTSGREPYFFVAEEMRSDRRC